jgi:hypothetical protein
MLSGLGSSPVKDFEDILIYVVQPGALRIVRVLRGWRDLKKLLEREQ